MSKGVHGEKIIAAMQSEKLPIEDKIRLENALKEYDKWLSQLNSMQGNSVSTLIKNMVTAFNEYKFYIDMNLIFDSPNDFLYRQKGQLKLDNTIIEEFMPILVKSCLAKEFGKCNFNIGAQVATFSSLHFTSNLNDLAVGGGINIKSKNQDFSISKKLYIKSSYDINFYDTQTSTIATNLGYILAELKTNLDKTMYQEASATARDIKLAITGAKYYLLCDFLDMKPISTATTDIDEILITRKAKRINSNIRKEFSSYSGRMNFKKYYMEFLLDNPYCSDVFQRFIEHIFSQIKNEELIESDILKIGYF